MTGMLGVYLVAAELSKRGFIVSPTSRSAVGADLLVTDQLCKKAWSVQVKTNYKSASYWLVGPKAREIISSSHVYVFVNVGKEDRAEFIVVPSKRVAALASSTAYGGKIWSSFRKSALKGTGKGWKLFGESGFTRVDTKKASTR